MTGGWMHNLDDLMTWESAPLSHGIAMQDPWGKRARLRLVYMLPTELDGIELGWVYAGRAGWICCVRKHFIRVCDEVMGGKYYITLNDDTFCYADSHHELLCLVEALLHWVSLGSSVPPNMWDRIGQPSRSGIWAYRPTLV